MTKITIHSNLFPQADVGPILWPEFREMLMVDADYQAMISQTSNPVLASRLETLAMADSDDWGLIAQLWNALATGAAISTEAPERWNGYAKNTNLPLSFNAEGMVSVTIEE